MGENCVFHEKIDQRLSDVEDDISDLKTKQLLDNQKFTMLLENLSELPKAINDMKDTMILMQTEIRETNRKTDDMKKQIDKLSDKVCAIDSEGQFNIRIFIQKNFPILVGLIMGGTGVWAWISSLI